MTRKVLVLMAAMMAVMMAAAMAGQVEQRSDAKWLTMNRFRVRLVSAALKGTPIAAELTMAPSFNPDSVRIIGEDNARILPAKVEWRNPAVRVSFVSTGVAG